MKSKYYVGCRDCPKFGHSLTKKEEKKEDLCDFHWRWKLERKNRKNGLPIGISISTWNLLK